MALGKAWRVRAWAFTLQTQLCAEGGRGASKPQLLSGAAQAEEDWAKTAWNPQSPARMLCYINANHGVLSNAFTFSHPQPHRSA